MIVDAGAQNQQDEIESTMDETTNNRAIVISHQPEEAAVETRGLVSEAILHEANTRKSGNSI